MSRESGHATEGAAAIGTLPSWQVTVIQEPNQTHAHLRPLLILGLLTSHWPYQQEWKEKRNEMCWTKNYRNLWMVQLEKSLEKREVKAEQLMGFLLHR